MGNCNRKQRNRNKHKETPPAPQPENRIVMGVKIKVNEVLAIIDKDGETMVTRKKNFDKMQKLRSDDVVAGYKLVIMNVLNLKVEKVLIPKEI